MNDKRYKKILKKPVRETTIKHKKRKVKIHRKKYKWPTNIIKF